MKAIYFDIETAPLPEAELAQFLPEPKPFNEADVKFGNIKDPEKIREKIENAKLDHDAAQARIRLEVIAKAALSALTGRVLAIGILESDFRGLAIFHGDNEADLLASFWNCYKSINEDFISFNGNSFDLPFLVRRSWKNGVTIPQGVRRGRYWSDRFIDLREIWLCGEYQGHGSLDTVSKFLGIGEKNGSGADFAKLYYENQAEALAYLQNDVELLEGLASKILG